MTIAFTLTRGGELTVAEPGHTTYARADIRAAVLELLKSKGGLDQWDAEEASERLRLERYWYSEAGGWGHDCSQHDPAEAGPQCEGMHPCILIMGLHPDVIDRLAADGELNRT